MGSDPSPKRLGEPVGIGHVLAKKNIAGRISQMESPSMILPIVCFLRFGLLAINAIIIEEPHIDNAAVTFGAMASATDFAGELTIVHQASRRSYN